MGGSDSDGMRDDENGGKVPVPPGNELLPGSVTIRLEDHDGRMELEGPPGTETVMLLPGREPTRLEETGPTTELAEPNGTELGTPLPDKPPAELEGGGYGKDSEAGATLLPGMLLRLNGGGTIVEPGVEVQLVDDSPTLELETGAIETLPGGMDAMAVDELKLKCLLELGRQEYPVPVPQ